MEIKENVAILTPSEYERLKAAVPKTQYKTILDFLLTTGMRYIEFQRFVNHQDQFVLYGNFIKLLPGASLKKKSIGAQGRNIRLPNITQLSIVRQILTDKIAPAQRSMNLNLKRWAADAKLDPTYISTKTFRKTCESWLVTLYPEKAPQILQSMGHNKVTQFEHYIGLAFAKDDIAAMKPYFDGVF